MIGSWEKEGTLREVQSVAPIGQSCVLACIPECVPGHTHCYEVLSRGSPSLTGLESALTVHSFI